MLRVAAGTVTRARPAAARSARRGLVTRLLTLQKIPGWCEQINGGGGGNRKREPEAPIAAYPTAIARNAAEERGQAEAGGAGSTPASVFGGAPVPNRATARWRPPGLEDSVRSEPELPLRVAATLAVLAPHAASDKLTERGRP